MIFYFSGTGNSKWVAQQIASKLNDKIYNITDIDTLPNVENEEYVGFVFPIYAWNTAEPMREFCKKLKKTNGFAFAVCTCGADAGGALKKLGEIYPLSSAYSVVMPDNYIVGFDTESDEKILEKIEKAKLQIETISQEILNKQKVYKVKEGKFAGLKTSLVSKGFENFARNTKKFYVTDSCNGCGICQKGCPAKTIKLENGKPVWGEKCYQCMYCINACPQTAIQYGKSTNGRKRYMIKNYI